tara:strand:- start:72146 stop:72415 length:270 start_codon:yes stop_codon:yes gene_type:complete
MKTLSFLLCLLFFVSCQENEKPIKYSNSLNQQVEANAAKKLDKVLGGEADEACDTEEETKEKLLAKIKKAEENNEAVSLQGSDDGCKVE